MRTNSRTDCSNRSEPVDRRRPARTRLGGWDCAQGHILKAQRKKPKGTASAGRLPCCVSVLARASVEEHKEGSGSSFLPSSSAPASSQSHRTLSKAAARTSPHGLRRHHGRRSDSKRPLVVPRHYGEGDRKPSPLEAPSLRPLRSPDGLDARAFQYVP